jgi:hypothetical protein
VRDGDSRFTLIRVKLDLIAGAVDVELNIRHLRRDFGMMNMPQLVLFCSLFLSRSGRMRLSRIKLNKKLLWIIAKRSVYSIVYIRYNYYLILTIWTLISFLV